MSGEDSKRQRISVEMSEPMVALIDQLKGEYAARSRGRVLEMLLQDLLDPGVQHRILRSILSRTMLKQRSPLGPMRSPVSF